MLHEKEVLDKKEVEYNKIYFYICKSGQYIWRHSCICQISSICKTVAMRRRPGFKSVMLLCYSIMKRAESCYVIMLLCREHMAERFM